MAQSVGAGLRYIFGSQRDDGAWTDWALPPGPSCTWTTAYVAYALAGVVRCAAFRAAARLRAAGGYLLENQNPDGGWGYNASVDSDADSTALSILALSSAGFAVPPAAYTCLREFQQPDGGFATYAPSGIADSWTVSHADVTPTCLFALVTHDSPAAPGVAAGLAYVRAQANEAGLWNSFWWATGLYATTMSLAVLRALDAWREVRPAREAIVAAQARTPFEVALLLRSSMLVGEHRPAFALARQLQQEQAADGSWRSEPSLRITPRDCFEPWNDPTRAGPLFADQHRLFTSATALTALGAWLADRPSGREP